MNAASVSQPGPKAPAPFLGGERGKIWDHLPAQGSSEEGMLGIRVRLWVRHEPHSLGNGPSLTRPPASSFMSETGSGDWPPHLAKGSGRRVGRPHQRAGLFLKGAKGTEGPLPVRRDGKSLACPLPPIAGLARAAGVSPGGWPHTAPGDARQPSPLPSTPGKAQGGAPPQAGAPVGSWPLKEGKASRLTSANMASDQAPHHPPKVPLPPGNAQT